MNRKLAAGQRYGSIEILSRAPDYKSPSGAKQPQWLCRCVCGEVVVRKTGNLHRSSKCSASCGIEGNATDHPLYKVWRNMIERCRNQNLPSWHRYGGRGIRVCDEWSNSFKQFLADMGERPTDKHQIERYDNDGPYAPWNCGWEPRIVQANNKGNTRYVEINGEWLPVIAVAALAGIPRRVALARIAAGWEGEDLLLPLHGKQRPAKVRVLRGRKVPRKGRPNLTSWITDLVNDNYSIPLP